MNIRRLGEEVKSKPAVNPIELMNSYMPVYKGGFYNINELQQYMASNASGYTNPQLDELLNHKSTNDTPTQEAKKAYQYYINKGIPAKVAAGFVGNFQSESRMNPTVAETGNTGEGRGIAQWGVNARWQDLQKWAKKNNRNYLELETQLDFAIEEAKQMGVYDKVANAKDAKEAALIISNEYEKPNKKFANNDRRMTIANKLHEQSTRKFAYGGYTAPYASIGNTLGAGVDWLNKDNSRGLNIASGTLKGAGQGAALGSVIPGVGTLIGGAVGAVVGGVTSAINDKKQREQVEMQNQAKLNQIKNNEMLRSEAIMQHYYANVGTGNSYYMAQGGQPAEQYEAEKGEVILGNANVEEGKQIASNMQVVKGKTHENGGTMVTGGDFVFSNRIIIGEDLAKAVISFGINVDSKTTFAETAQLIGEIKGKNEKKGDTKSYVVGTTSKLNIQKLDALTQMLIMAQEQYKENGAFAYGGYTKMQGGGKVPSYIADGTIEPFNLDYKTVGNPFQYVTTDPYTVKDKSFDPYAKKTFQGLDIKPISIKSTVKPATTSQKPFQSQIPKDIKLDINNKSLGNLSQYADYLPTIVQYFANRAAINKMKTNVPTYLNNNPAYLYVDRTGLALQDVDNTVNNTIKSIDASGGTQSDKALVASKAMEAKNNIRNQENSVRDRYNQQYAYNVYQNQVANNANMQQAERMRIDNENQITQQKAQANNTLLTDIQKVRAEQNRENLDNLRMMMYNRLYNIGRGTGDYDNVEIGKRIEQGTATYLDKYLFSIFNKGYGN